MTLTAIGMVKDEADVIEGVLHHLDSEGVDHIIVLDNESTDGTSGLILATAAELTCKVTRITDHEVGYYQSRKISQACDLLVDEGSWVVPFDADELWHAGTVPLAEYFAGFGPDVGVVGASLLSHFGTAVDPNQGDVFSRFVWRHPDVAPLPKWAVRWVEGTVITQGAHGIQHPRRRIGSRWSVDREGSGLFVRHFPYRSVEQFARKVVNGALAYAAAPDLPEGMGAHWKGYAQLLRDDGVDGIAAVMHEHYFFEDPVAAAMILDPAPYRRWDS